MTGERSQRKLIKTGLCLDDLQGCIKFSITPVGRGFGSYQVCWEEYQVGKGNEKCREVIFLLSLQVQNKGIWNFQPTSSGCVSNNLTQSEPKQKVLQYPKCKLRY